MTELSGFIGRHSANPVICHPPVGCKQSYRSNAVVQCGMVQSGDRYRFDQFQGYDRNRTPGRLFRHSRRAPLLVTSITQEPFRLLFSVPRTDSSSLPILLA
jgi:hypothetical protein